MEVELVEGNGWRREGFRFQEPPPSSFHLNPNKYHKLRLAVRGSAICLKHSRRRKRKKKEGEEKTIRIKKNNKYVSGIDQKGNILPLVFFIACRKSETVVLWLIYPSSMRHPAFL